ncbi:MAG: hypothetical protein ABJA80_16685 [bacterium]
MTSDSPDEQICKAIQDRALILFEDGDLIRVVEPHCLGIDAVGAEVLFCWLRTGQTRADRSSGWRHYLVSEMSGMQVLDAPFLAERPGYARQELRMCDIRCELITARAAEHAVA